MKKSIIFAVLLGIALYGCKKDEEYPSQTRAVSSPTITFTGSQFYSIKIGDPLPTVQATAFDSLLGESYPVTVEGTEAVDNTTPGLYVISATSTNRNTYVSNENVYVAVTNIPESANLSGTYERAATGVRTQVTELANGLYSIGNFFGADGLDADAYFVQVNDSTIAFPPQETALGYLVTSNQRLSQKPGDTTLSWVLNSLTTNRAVRTFKKL